MHQSIERFARPAGALTLGLGLFAASHVLAHAPSHTVDPNGCEHATDQVTNYCNLGYPTSKAVVNEGYGNGTIGDPNGFTIYAQRATVYASLWCRSVATGQAYQVTPASGQTAYSPSDGIVFASCGNQGFAGSVCGSSVNCGGVMP